MTVWFPFTEERVIEGETIRPCLRLSEDPGREVTIPLTVTHLSGASAADYTMEETSVTFVADDDSECFDFEAIADGIDDDGERVRIGIGTPLPDPESPGCLNPSGAGERSR
ncbi:MAG: hypothetical protein OXH41_04205 [Chloroflexi bacterium]|nr:hypothetical protein [Chloroflexota bacterium]